MAPRQRKKGRKQDGETSANATTEQAARKKSPKTRSNKATKKGSSKLYLWGSIAVGFVVFGWLFLYAANLGGGFKWMDGATRHFLKSFVCQRSQRRILSCGCCSISTYPKSQTADSSRRASLGSSSSFANLGSGCPS